MDLKICLQLGIYFGDEKLVSYFYALTRGRTLKEKLQQGRRDTFNTLKLYWYWRESRQDKEAKKIIRREAPSLFSNRPAGSTIDQALLSRLLLDRSCIYTRICRVDRTAGGRTDEETDAYFLGHIMKRRQLNVVIRKTPYELFGRWEVQWLLHLPREVYLHVVSFLTGETSWKGV